MNDPKKLTPNIKWIGGKARSTHLLLPLLPKHHAYVEVFGGAGALILAKAPGKVDVYNDLDSGLVSFYRTLRDPASFAAFSRALALTPFSREEWRAAKNAYPTCTDEIERARLFFILARQSFGGDFAHSWGYAAEETARGMSKEVSAWLSAIDRLPEIVARFQAIQIEHDDWRKIIARYDRPETLFYLDPPYVNGSRKDRGTKYRCELTDLDHAELVDAALLTVGRVLLSGYASPLYTPLEQAGWTTLAFAKTCTVAGRTKQNGYLGVGSTQAAQAREERLWLNYNPPGALPAGLAYVEGR